MSEADIELCTDADTPEQQAALRGTLAGLCQTAVTRGHAVDEAGHVDGLNYYARANANGDLQTLSIENTATSLAARLERRLGRRLTVDHEPTEAQRPCTVRNTAAVDVAYEIHPSRGRAEHGWLLPGQLKRFGGEFTLRIKDTAVAGPVAVRRFPW